MHSSPRSRRSSVRPSENLDRDDVEPITTALLAGLWRYPLLGALGGGLGCAVEAHDAPALMLHGHRVGVAHVRPGRDDRPEHIRVVDGQRAGVLAGAGAGDGVAAVGGGGLVAGFLRHSGFAPLMAGVRWPRLSRLPSRRPRWR